MRNRAEDVMLALVLLTRLPLPRLPQSAFAHSARAAWAYPLAGVAVAVPAVLAGMGALWAGLSAPVAALVIVAAEVALTGAMHEDGLADTADGLWGGWTRERRLEIMHDSRIGTYGVLALIVSVGLRVAALTVLVGAGFAALIAAAFAAGVLSRGVLPAMMHLMPHARDDGLSQSVGRPGAGTATVAALLALVLAGLAAGPAALACAALAALGCLGLGAVARARIGGQTGDILGAAQQCATILSLLVFASVCA